MYTEQSHEFPFLAAPPFFPSCTKPRPLPQLSSSFFFFFFFPSLHLASGSTRTNTNLSVGPQPPILQVFPLHRRKKARRGPSNLETTIFSSSSPFFFLLLLFAPPPPPPESDRRPCFSASTVRIVRSSALEHQFLHRRDRDAAREISFSSSSSSPLRVDHEPEATRIASSLPPLHLAALTPTGARCASVTLLRFPFRKNRHSIVYLHLRLLYK